MIFIVFIFTAMIQTLSIFNISLKKLLHTESNTLNKARIQILYFVILFAIVKTFVVIVFACYYSQNVQLYRALAGFCIFAVVLKIHLSKLASINTLSHILGAYVVVLIYTSLFITAQTINIINLQFAFMIMLSSFYLLNRYWGIAYSIITVLPFTTFLLLSHYSQLPVSIEPQRLKFPADLLIITLNFISMITCHFLYHRAFSENISEKQELNIKLAQAVETANKHAQSKSDFLSTMSHELRTPLNMVIGMSELLMDSKQTDEQRENLQILNFSAKNLHTLVNDILDFNKLESERIELENVRVNLYELIHAVCSGLDIQAREKGLIFNLLLDNLLKPRYVSTDPTRLTQIIYNLVGNGIKFTEHGQVNLNVQVLRENNDNVEVSFLVSDTGIGINEQQQQIIFHPFVQASTSTTRKFGGTGLGLSIVKRLLDLFNSTIHVESREGQGSNFSFTINFEIDNTISLLHEYATTKQNGDLSGLRVLAAEDNALNVLLLEKLCAKWNIKPLIVSDGRKAVEAVTNTDYDVVLMDIHMPEMDGYEASKIIRKMTHEIKSQIPIIALTASVSHNLEDKIKAVGMTDYIRKPFHPEELFAKLKRYHQT